MPMREVMIKQLQAVRGTQSLYGEDADRFHRVVAAFDSLRRGHRFRHVEVPIMEYIEVFARSLGETTDIVSKEMYSFQDRNGDLLTLRPELTAGIVRAYLTEGWQQFTPFKVATWGPAFRYERPQKGRYRQFHQIDVEVLGASEPAADVELIVFGAQLLKRLGIAHLAELQINTLGDSVSREKWRDALIGYFKKHKKDLSQDSLKRLKVNPLRILDSKEPQDREVSLQAPSIEDFLTEVARDFFGQVREGLAGAGIKPVHNNRLVRGLDYYRHTIFEFVTDSLGAQGTLIGGGRYDGLVEAMGGPPTPAVGWAGGIERLAMLLPAPKGRPQIFAVVPESDAAEPLAQQIAFLLRERRMKVDYLYKGSARKRVERYQRRGATTAIYVDVDAQVSHIAGSVNVKQFRSMTFSSERKIEDNMKVLSDILSRNFDVRREGNINGRIVDFVLSPKATQ